MKINFGIFKKISGAVSVALELKKLVALWDDCKSLGPLLEEMRAPARNLLIEFRKKVDAAEAAAAATENEIDDKIVAGLKGVADWLLDIFHAEDDYQRMKDLDDQVKG